MLRYTAGQVIAEYVRVLQALAALRCHGPAPEEVLPLPREEMVALLQSSTSPNKEMLIGLLDRGGVWWKCT